MRDAYTNYSGSRYTDVWLMLGDNAYNASTDAQFDAAVFGMFAEMFRQTALWPERGNDDHFVGYCDAFTLPQNGEAGGVPSGWKSVTPWPIAVHVLPSSMKRRTPPNTPTWGRNRLMITRRGR